MGVWIETEAVYPNRSSLFVTPCVGVWIETYYQKNHYFCKTVTPCVGVWIETNRVYNLTLMDKSHPAWVCGLKL